MPRGTGHAALRALGDGKIGLDVPAPPPAKTTPSFARPLTPVPAGDPSGSSVSLLSSGSVSHSGSLLSVEIAFSPAERSKRISRPGRRSQDPPVPPELIRAGRCPGRASLVTTSRLMHARSPIVATTPSAKRRATGRRSFLAMSSPVVSRTTYRNRTSRDAEETQFLGDDGEDEVGRVLGEVAELEPVPEPSPDDLAVGDGAHGLDDVEAVTGGVGVGSMNEVIRHAVVGGEQTSRDDRKPSRCQQTDVPELMPAASRMITPEAPIRTAVPGLPS